MERSLRKLLFIPILLVVLAFSFLIISDQSYAATTTPVKHAIVDISGPSQSIDGVGRFYMQRDYSDRLSLYYEDEYGASTLLEIGYYSNEARFEIFTNGESIVISSYSPSQGMAIVFEDVYGGMFFNRDVLEVNDSAFVSKVYMSDEAVVVQYYEAPEGTENYSGHIATYKKYSGVHVIRGSYIIKTAMASNYIFYTKDVTDHKNIHRYNLAAASGKIIVRGCSHGVAMNFTETNVPGKIIYYKKLSTGKYGLYTASYSGTSVVRIATLPSNVSCIDKVTSKYVYYQTYSSGNNIGYKRYNRSAKTVTTITEDSYRRVCPCFE